jgi:hypothetical protein
MGMVMVIEICAKYSGGPTLINATDIPPCPCPNNAVLSTQNSQRQPAPIAE